MIAFVALPISYSWLLSPGEDPPWLTPVIAVAEWGGLACAAAALWLARRIHTRSSVIARRLAWASIVIYVATFIILAALYR